MTWTHQPTKSKRAGRLAKMNRAEHVADVAAKYQRAAARVPGLRVPVVRVIDGVIHIDGERKRIGDVARMTRALKERATR